VLLAMQHDRGYMKELTAGAVIHRSDAGFAQWREQRDRFQALMGQVFTERYSLQPGAADVLRLFTYQFLQGNAAHLLGNLAVLLLAGPFAEAALGRGRFLLAYLASGAIAGAAHLVISDHGLIGARPSQARWRWSWCSTALARCRCSTGCSSANTARSAVLLLPVWLVIEAVQWILAPASRLHAPTLHGFISGATIAWLLAR
jgi:membrane associated rhomboid family serine protease